MATASDDNGYAFLTGKIDGIGGQIKSCCEDFCVEEVPLYEASGEGTHVYAFIEKRNITTNEALSRIAKELGRKPRDIGSAGQKDARAVTRQWISVEHVEPEEVLALEVPDMRVVEVRRHTNKLKLGHLKANRFVIKVRETDQPAKQAAKLAEACLEVLGSRGVPNYFGPQRFGNRGNNGLLGKSLVKQDWDGFFEQFLGEPMASDSPSVRRARKLYDEGDYERALAEWPGNFRDERRALNSLLKNKGKQYKALYAIDKNMKSFFISAYQSAVFNRVLNQRMPDIDKVLDGDMAYKHVNGACFKVEDAAVEQERCEAFEISPTGPLMGPKMRLLEGAAGEIENAVLEAEGVTAKDFKECRFCPVQGGRRPLRFQPRDWSVGSGSDDGGDYVEVRFELDSGCYATTVLREIAKTEIC